jgi:hypothetical protein
MYKDDMLFVETVIIDNIELFIRVIRSYNPTIVVSKLIDIFVLAIVFTDIKFVLMVEKVNVLPYAKFVFVVSAIVLSERAILLG